MAEEVEREKAQLREMVDAAQAKVPMINEAVANVVAVSEELQRRQEELSGDVNRLFDALAKAVEERRAALLEEIQTREREKQETLGKGYRNSAVW